MAKKSKTQRAKASANRAAKKERAAEELANPVVEEESKKSFFEKRAEKQEEKKERELQQSHQKVARNKKRHFGFLSDVRSEMRRVTWPSKQEVLQWTGVVVVALLFFGVFVVVLDDWVVTPILLFISGLGA